MAKTANDRMYSTQDETDSNAYTTLCDNAVMNACVMRAAYASPWVGCSCSLLLKRCNEMANANVTNVRKHTYKTTHATNMTSSKAGQTDATGRNNTQTCVYALPSMRCVADAGP